MSGPHRGGQKKGTPSDIRCYEHFYEVDYISHNPFIKQIVKDGLAQLFKDGYSLLRVCDYIGYDLKKIKAWCNSHRSTKQTKVAHGPIIILLRILGYEMKVTLDEVGPDKEYLERFKLLDRDIKEWEKRNEDSLPKSV